MVAVIDSLLDTAVKIGEDVKEFITEKPIESAIVGTGIGGVLGVGAGLVLGANGKTTTKKKSRKRTKRGIKRDRMFKSKQKHERRYKRKKRYKVYGRKGWINPKKKRRSGKKRVGKTYYTKKGQPYKIMASGKARFIKKGGRK